MNTFLRIFLLALLGVAAFGCASPRTYQVQVNGYTDSTAPLLVPGASIFVLEDPKAQNPLLEKEVKNKIDSLLVKHGYLLAPREQAKYFLQFSYGMGAPQTLAVTTPSWEIGVGFGTGGWGPGVGWGTYWPGCGPYYTETQALYDRWLRLNVVEAKPYRESGQSRSVWVGEARSAGSSSDLREVLNSLLIAAFEQLGRNTGKALPVAIKGNDPRFTELERVH
ncbi:MAG: DUF4136 domain-containing protein [Desulfobaccales bacterium]